MKHRFILLYCLAVLALASPLAAESAQDTLIVTTELSQGYRKDKTQYKGHDKFSIRDANIYQTRLAAKLAWNSYFARAQVGYGVVMNGKMKGLTFTNNYLNTRKGYTLDANIAVGKDFQVTEKSTLSPLFGYAWESQHFDLKKKNDFTPHFIARWNAPFIGVRGEMQAMDDIAIYGEYDLLFAVDYNAHLSHKHWAFGKEKYSLQSQRLKSFGHVGTVGASYKIFENCSFKTEYQLSKIIAKGSKKRGISKEINNTSHEVRLCIDYAF